MLLPTLRLPKAPRPLTVTTSFVSSVDSPSVTPDMPVVPSYTLETPVADAVSPLVTTWCEPTTVTVLLKLALFSVTNPATPNW